MPTVKDVNNPSFVLFPVNNDRTGWRPFGLPVIMVVPNRRTLTGSTISNSQVFNVRVFIEDVPREARVAGHDNVGVRFPDRELFVETIDSFGLAERIIDPSQYTFTRDGQEIDFSEAEEGDVFTYVTSTGVRDTITYIPGANYYDLSDVNIDYEHLPSDKYNQVYQAEYFTRIVSQDGRDELLCIDASRTSLAILRFNVKHPGEVIEEFERHTPPPYLTNATRANDTTLALYRPFTDALNDIMDEQNLLESINWVFETPAEAIPYLSQLLGWDIPFFPESLDQLRRAVLRRTVEFQNLAGSRRAVINLFRLFGFEILISNLWWSSDGERLIRPDERLPSPYQPLEIVTEERCQIDATLSDYNEQGFGVFNIPLLFRPQEVAGLDDFTALRDGGNVTIDCYFVEVGSAAYDELVKISQDAQNDPQGYGEESGCGMDSNGFLIPLDINSRMTGLDVVGYSQILIEGKLGEAVDEVLVGPEIPLKKEGVSLNRETNELSLTLNGALDYEGRINNTPRTVFAFTTYKRQQFVVPDVLKDLQSNRFDIQVVTEDLTEYADPVFLEFAVEFLFRVKAFHSLLNKIIYSIELTETYEVTDWCVGGDVTQRFDTDAGTLQVPPAIIPDIPTDINDCTRLDPTSLGYKDEDIILRLRKLANLPEEHASWRALDARSDQPSGGTRLGLMDVAPGRAECKFTHRGQDRIVGERNELRTTEYGPSPNTGSMAAGFASNPETSPVEDADNGQFAATSGAASSNNDSSPYGSFTREYTDIRQPWCDLDQVTDYCYKGRVDDELLYRPTIVAGEQHVCKPCSIDLGIGVYYLYPTYSVMVVKGVKKPCPNSLTNYSVFSGGAREGNQTVHLEGIQGDYLTAPYDKPLEKDSHLSRLYRDYDEPQDYTLHYSNRVGQPNENQQNNLALQRPSLNVQKPTLHLPGCRFPRINAIEDDFFHPEWEARPWDDDFSTHCGPKFICGNAEPTFLNCTKTVGSDGNEYLSFDSQPFQVLGNGLVPDIPSLGDHTLGTNALFEADDVIHAVYMKNASGNPAVELDGVCDYDTSVASDDTIVIDDPLFSSHNECNTGELVDFADGYACESGEKAYTPQDIGQSGLYEEVLDALGIPSQSGTGAPSTLLIFLNSGILDESGLRLDCGCLLVSCDGTQAEGETICSSDDFIDDDGFYDWNCDHLQVTQIMKNVEPMGVCSIQLDGTIGSLLEVV